MDFGPNWTVERKFAQVFLVGAIALVPQIASAQTKLQFERGEKPSVVIIDGNQCTSPCSLMISPGAHTVAIDGKHVDLRVPETKAGETARFRSDIDVIDVVGGGAVSGVGLAVAVITLLAAAGAFYGTDDNGDATGLAPICCGSEAILLGLSAVAIIAGGIWLGLGILHSGPRVTVARGEQRNMMFAPGALRISF